MDKNQVRRLYSSFNFSCSEKELFAFCNRYLSKNKEKNFKQEYEKKNKSEVGKSMGIKLEKQSYSLPVTNKYGDCCIKNILPGYLACSTIIILDKTRESSRKQCKYIFAKQVDISSPTEPLSEDDKSFLEDFVKKYRGEQLYVINEDIIDMLSTNRRRKELFTRLVQLYNYSE